MQYGLQTKNNLKGSVSISSQKEKQKTTLTSVKNNLFIFVYI